MDARLLEAIAGNDALAFTHLVRENETILEQTTANGLNTALHLALKFGSNNLVMEIIKLRLSLVATLKSNGHLNVVKVLLNQPWLEGLEDDADLTTAHEAASKGQIEILREIINIYLELGRKVDRNGRSALHSACSKGRLDITKMLLQYDLDLAFQFDNNGYTPLHLAPMNGDTGILKAFMSIRSMSHTRWRYCISSYSKLADYIVYKANVDVNYRNYRGHTMLDILNEAGCTSEIQLLKEKIKRACGRTGIALLQRQRGTLGAAFAGVIVMLVEHWLRRLKWIKERKRDLRRERIASFNSDMESCYHRVYHSF
ncbi:ankyrin repeat-containing protein At5g02620-like [Durio zibethinus]|uniref:Ankyrin repeat-containing protein At5g02620-like n=1 Tax=Durio zibethinus TaxID=66656 RepID=A0A6P5X6I3_DURZI|nr:ankyrin repeat-containing protein At5g02620-like [Durio zibethinus]